MPAKQILEIEKIDLNAVAVSKEEVLKLNAQRFEFEQLDKLAYLDKEAGIAVGVKEQKEDEFWTRGHLPGRPIMPGVMMIEMAAQLGSILFHKKFDTEGKVFFGFGGVNNVKFRGAVEPGAIFVMVVQATKFRSKIAMFDALGYVNNKLVFEAEVTGVVF